MQQIDIAYYKIGKRKFQYNKAKKNPDKNRDF
jgi:hypothetical protein